MVGLAGVALAGMALAVAGYGRRLPWRHWPSLARAALVVARRSRGEGGSDGACRSAPVARHDVWEWEAPGAQRVVGARDAVGERVENAAAQGRGRGRRLKPDMREIRFLPVQRS
jgi:hypothetical protein